LKLADGVHWEHQCSMINGKASGTICYLVKIYLKNGVTEMISPS
jgi:hypothetical protein